MRNMAKSKSRKRCDLISRSLKRFESVIHDQHMEALVFAYSSLGSPGRFVTRTVDKEVVFGKFFGGVSRSSFVWKDVAMFVYRVSCTTGSNSSSRSQIEKTKAKLAQCGSLDGMLTIIAEAVDANPEGLEAGIATHSARVDAVEAVVGGGGDDAADVAVVERDLNAWLSLM